MENVSDVYVLTPMQAGMLFHTIRDPGSGVFVEQLAVTLDAPIDDSEKPGVDDGEGDVLVPAPGSEKSTQSRLFRGALTNVQARTGRTESATRLRLAGQTRRYHESHPVHWSGRDNKRQPALQWIEAPARDGRIRL